MRGLAEFIMRGRWQALGVAVLGSGSLLFGWISAAAIALVTLRKGTASGGWLVLWALFGGLGCLFWSSLGGLGGYLRRRTVPWSLQGRFPGFSGKFREAFWLHFEVTLSVFSLFFWGLFFDATSVFDRVRVGV